MVTIMVERGLDGEEFYMRLVYIFANMPLITTVSPR
jgi:hypothetical protein